MIRADCEASTIDTVSEHRYLEFIMKPLVFAVFFALILCFAMPRQADAGPFPEKGSVDVRRVVEKVYFYPREGQTPEQQERDRYECFIWAVQQTGFDPNLPLTLPERPVRVEAAPPVGHDTVALGVTGAMVGALAAGPRHAPGGALIGAVLGMMAGAVSDSGRREYAWRVEEAYAASDRTRGSQLQWKILEYRRAMSTCLEGRGYSVR
ncbi:MAG: glycine zipper family protein [Deltaproteobacteria bacterium]|nr:glycine zipper family protein [Deltaproteobacteria bacterium]